MAVRKRVGAVMALVTAICTFATAPAHADPVAMAPQTYTKVTRDGWTLVIRIDHETINSVPNLAEASNSREAFVTFDATAVATGGSARSPTVFSSPGINWVARQTFPAVCRLVARVVSQGPLAIAAGRRLVVPVDLPVSSRRSCSRV